MLHHPRGGLGVKESGTVFPKHHRWRGIARYHEDDEIEFAGPIIKSVVPFHSQHIAPVGGVGPVISIKEGIEQLDAGAQSLHHLIERNVLVIERFQDGLANPGQQFAVR